MEPEYVVVDAGKELIADEAQLPGAKGKKQPNEEKLEKEYQYLKEKCFGVSNNDQLMKDQLKKELYSLKAKHEQLCQQKDDVLEEMRRCEIQLGIQQTSLNLK